MKLYKLTNQDGTTHNGFPYAITGKEEHQLPEVVNPKTCSKNVFHAYKSIELAFLLNQIHANIKDPRLWEIDGDVVVEHWDKVGSFNQRIVQELPIPSWVRDNKVRVRFAKMCADAARVAADAARAAYDDAYDAAYNAAYDAARVAYAAAARAAAYDAARVAARAAADAADAARAAARAAAAAYAAYDAARIADYSAADYSAAADYSSTADAARADADADYSAAAAAARAARIAARASAGITIDIQKIAELAINQHQTK